jgi:hypothetical protein
VAEPQRSFWTAFSDEDAPVRQRVFPTPTPTFSRFWDFRSYVLTLYIVARPRNSGLPRRGAPGADLRS